MQLKGLIRFFTILLILYSFYELSFTWVVRSHEKKLEAQATSFVNFNYRNADPATKKEAVAQRLKRLKDSTKNQTVHYGPTGAISYQTAKQNELNLGLDLQGGINVTLEVELAGLLQSMANNSKDPQFLQALQNADKRKANSDADFVTLFRDEYKKLNPNGRLASLFAVAGQDRIKPNATDDQVVGAIRTEANDAFDRTFRVLHTRIDQFGVAQPNINPDKQRGIITVELPGVQDEERVRKFLQSSANLQFWEVYNLSELVTSLQAADKAFVAAMGGNTDTTGGKKIDSANMPSLFRYLIPLQQDNGMVGMVSTNDTALVRQYLDMPTVRASFPADIAFAYGMPDAKQGQQAAYVPLYGLKTYGRAKAKIEGEGIVDARNDFNQVSGKSEVTMKMNPAAARLWADMTGANKGRFIAIVLDNIVYSAPVVNDKIEGGSSSISGGFSITEAKDLANILKAGKLPAPAKIVQFQQVGPTLGQDAVKGGMYAFGLSFVVIFLLMLVYYNTSGWVANIALILNLLFTIGVLTGLGATLTAPGIAGLVLTIGMAVDTNVIIYERIKEELTKGRNYVQAVNEGYRRSLPPVLDAHVTTLLTAIILFSFGLGPVKGFATTQIIGILLSLFCGILVSRWVSDIFTNKNRHLEYFTGISKRVFKHAAYKFIEYRKVAYVISGVVLLLGVASLFHGFDYGVEFRGGRSYVVRFDKPVNVDQVREDLKASFDGENPVIKTIGADNQLDITTSYLITQTGAATDNAVQTRLFQGLQKHLPAGVSYEQFSQQYRLGSTTVLPTISDDLKNGAKWATFWSVLIIAIYIFIRFRDWRYSAGTIFALLHDVLVTLAVFSFLREVVPFPLEIDQHFIAAILTVIGFSMNDTVIVFDRIRETSREMPNAPRGVIINKAINETLSRTIMTSLTVFLTILILFLVGGEVTRGFAFAMLIGVITGIYSSIFVAAPILVDLGGKKPLGGDAPVVSEEPAKTRNEKALAKH
ncbi:MAG: protein translocase subunit SecD [Chitinophagaceae bacterium]|nr:MAG: protein translocase subunit SecD [Chitinophagaceae bacterium]